MAGIGFELKKLFQEKTATGYFKAYAYTAVVSAGPFILMTSMVLAIQMLFKFYAVSYFDSQVYTASVIYSFVFSHILSSGFAMLITRYIADLLYREVYDEIVPSLYGMLTIALAIASLFAILFFWQKPLAWEIKLTTYVFYMMMMMIWLESVYLSALKDYKKILQSYAVGVFIAVLIAFLFLHQQILPPVFGSLLAMDIGGFFIAIGLLMNIKKFFPETSKKYFLFLTYFETNAKLFFVNLSYTLSLYIPNIIIWQGHLGISIADTYRYAPSYDVATFYGFLSILPVMIFFVISTEIHFYEKYALYFMYITEKGIFKEIEEARQDLIHVMWSELRNTIEFQLVFALIFLALGNYLLPKVGLDYESINMYNLIVLGAFSTGVLQILVTLMLYFEDQKGALWCCLIFFLTNAGLNVFGLLVVGQISYGFTFFLAAFLSLLLAIFRLSRFTKKLDYFIFCSRPVFYQPPSWILTRLVKRFYPDE